MGEKTKINWNATEIKINFSYTIEKKFFQNLFA